MIHQLEKAENEIKPLAKAFTIDDFSPPDFLAKITEPEKNKRMLLDLGKVYTVDECILTPSAFPNFQERSLVYGFPKRFSIRGSEDPEFKSSTVIFETGQTSFPNPRLKPVIFKIAHPFPCRYIEFKILEGFPILNEHVFSLSEIFIFSEGKNVTKDILCYNPEDFFKPYHINNLFDGKTPFGLPERESSPSPYLGWSSTWKENFPVNASFDIIFNHDQKVDELRLYPASNWYIKADPTQEFPNQIEFSVKNNQGQWDTIFKSRNHSLLGNSPWIKHFEQQQGQHFRLILRKSKFSKVIRLSEIELISDGKQISSHAQIATNDSTDFDGKWTPDAINDGYASRGKIIPVQTWLRELSLRHELKRTIKSTTKIISKLQLEIHNYLLYLIFIGVVIIIYTTFWLLLKRHYQIEHLRQQIASDLHDEVGSNLAGISLICRDLTESDYEKSYQRERLNKALSISQETSDAMKDIIWMLHPNRKAQKQLQDYLRDLMHRLLPNVETDFQSGDVEVFSQLELNQQREFLFFYREYLHNLQKHSQANHVSITFKHQHHQAILEIKDDGIDITTFECPKSLKRRIQKLSAELIRQRLEHQQNHLQLSIPLNQSHHS